ncbi:hypothetical protein BGZ83_009132, partial [Gryganskiella cystojenkinii]
MKFTSLLTIAAAVCMVSAVNAKAAPAPADACADLSKQSDSGSVNLDTVRACYSTFKFDKDIAHKTIDSLTSLYGNFFPFIDSAKEHHGSPFVTPKVDLLAELQKIKNHKWKSDYEFQTALHLLAASVNDGHLGYNFVCYQTVVFRQPIGLYAPVVN